MRHHEHGDSRGGKDGTGDQRANKMVSEIYLTRLLSTKVRFVYQVETYPRPSLT